MTEEIAEGHSTLNDTNDPRTCQKKRVSACVRHASMMIGGTAERAGWHLNIGYNDLQMDCEHIPSCKI
jgi:hypothetical protein